MHSDACHLSRAQKCLATAVFRSPSEAGRREGRGVRTLVHGSLSVATSQIVTPAQGPNAPLKGDGRYAERLRGAGR